MLAKSDQNGWRGWAELVRAALQPGPPIDHEELLLVRDSAGRALRPLNPPPGVVARPAAVLILLYPDGDDLRLPLTIRSNHLPSHRGEVSLPGGAIDPNDGDAAATALRETHEEIGIEPHTINIWGSLSPIYVAPSNFQIEPIVGMCAQPPQLQLNHAEVDAVITTTLRELIDPAIIRSEMRILREHEVLVPFFAVADQKVWGATALILSEFVARLRRGAATMAAPAHTAVPH